MTWRVGKLSGGVGSTWQIGKLSGAVANAPVTTWRLAKLSGKIGGGWRVTKLSGLVAQAVTPVLATPATQTVDPLQTATIRVLTSNGVLPDSYSFTSPGVTLTANGNTVSFVAPGTTTGGTVTVTVTATKNGNTSPPITASVIVPAAPAQFLSLDGTMHAVSTAYQA